MAPKGTRKGVPCPISTSDPKEERVLLKYQLQYQLENPTPLKSSDYRNLAIKKHLTGSVIDFYLSYLVSKKYRGEQNVNGFLIFDTNIQNRTEKEFPEIIERLQVNLFEKKYLVFPRKHEHVQKTWYLVIIKNPVFAFCPSEDHRPKIYFFDPYAEEETGKKIIEFSSSFLIEAAKLEINKSLDKISQPFQFHNLSKIKQDNRCDSGVHILLYMEAIIKTNKFLKFDRSDKGKENYAEDVKYLRVWLSELIKNESYDQKGREMLKIFPEIELPKIKCKPKP